MSTATKGTFHGRPVRQRKVGGFRVLELVYAPHYDAGRHEHSHAHLALSLAGAYDEKTGNKEVLCDPSTTIFRPAGVVHYSRNREVLNRVLAVDIQPEAVATCVSHLRLEEPHTAVSGPLTVAMRRLQVEFSRDDPFCGFAIYGLVLEALAILGRDRLSSHPPSWIELVDAAVRDSREIPSVRELATMAGLSETSFSRHFRRHFNTSVGQYVRKRRFEKAVRFLEQTDMPLAEVAFQTGFVDQSHFTNAFKAEFGMTPNRYRKANCA
ncbi:MAG: helix-turn-helix domain-containing protein [Fimbriimonas sp.]